MSTSETDLQTPAARRLIERLYGLWFGAVFLVCALTALFAVLLLPTLAWRQWVVRHMAAAVFRLTGTGPSIAGLRALPDGPCVVVANHASYLDGIVMTAVLPPRFSFVIKGEMQSVPLAGLLLRRIDSFFVDRSGPHASASSARQILRAARSGRALGFFPEGTFTEQPGLRAFRRGAFAAAKAGRMAIVPVAIRGTRHILPADRWWPRPGHIDVDILPPMSADDVDEQEVGALADRARRAVLAHAGEPDLLAGAINAGP